MSGVNLSMEVPHENCIQEITYDGQEILQTPLTMSENLSRLAQRIEFSAKDEDDPNASNSNIEIKEEEGSETFKTVPAWPWESVRNKLRNSLTELSVLSDILAIAKEKKYLVLDPIQAEAPETRIAANLYYKKKALQAAASVLSTGFDRLRTSLNEAKSRSSLHALPDFHIELLKLRQNWRLRKVGNSILGDLSYRTAGSRFPQAGIFEVTKAEDDDGSDSEDRTHPQNSALRVSVPKELQGLAYIQVVIQEEGADVLSVSNLGPTPGPIDGHWQQRLEAAQNVLFCRELFSVLAREAVTCGASAIPPLVVGNQITATLFPGILLSISLLHGGSGKGNAPSGPTPKLDHNHVLEHSLHQLLREVHRTNASVPLPHPVTAPIGVSKKRRLGGPLAFDRQTLLNMTKKEGILEEIIRQAQHVVLRLRTMFVIDTLAKDVRDPLITAHWSSLNAVTHSCARVSLVSSGYDITTKTQIVVHVKEKTIKCILKDGKAIHLSFEPQELRDLIVCQIAIHQMNAIQSLSKCLGWTVLSSSPHLGVGTCERLGNAAGCLLSSRNGKTMLAVRSSPSLYSDESKSGVEVYVGSFGDRSISEDDDLMNGEENGHCEETIALPQGASYKKIDMENVEGRNFLNKMETLMAVLADVVE